MEDIVVSAPGKVILHGEHAVVYGKVAVAASLNLRTYLHLKRRNDNQVGVSLPNINLDARWNTKDLKAAVGLPICQPNQPTAASEEILAKLLHLAGLSPDESNTENLAAVTFFYLYCAIAGHKGTLPPVDIKVVSRQPVSAGLGSSAAFCVCLTASLLQLCGLVSMATDKGTWSEEEHNLINSWAYFGEKILHGNPSGIDNSVSTFGGAIKFQSGKITPLKLVPRLQILLVNTGVPRSTKVLVAGVRDRYNKYPDVMQPVLDSIEAISQRAMTLFTEMSDSPSDDLYKSLEDLIDINQHHLGSLGVSHPALEEIVMLAAKHKLHAKLTGAGGGGCAFILIKPGTPAQTIIDIKSEFESRQLMCWETSVGSTGVMAHGMQDDNGHIQNIFS